MLNGPVLAKDNDIGTNAVVKYKLLGARMDIFTVEANTGNTVKPLSKDNKTSIPETHSNMSVSAGVIRVHQGGSLDREAFQEPRVELFLVAEDIGGLNSSVPLTVAILDENDNPPVFSPSSYSVRLPENSPTGVWIPLRLKISPFIKMCRPQVEVAVDKHRCKRPFSVHVSAGVVVTQLSAADADSGSNGWLMYRLESGAQDRFVVEPLSGAVLVGNTTLDREERGSYRLVVIAIDRGTPPMSGTATLTVILDDVNDSSPRFIEPVTLINVNESTPPGVVVATLTAEDPDLHPRLEYYIISVEAKDDGNNPVNGLQESFGIDLHTGETLLTSDR